MKKILGWIVRGGDHTRAALTRQDEAIADLQHKVEHLTRASEDLHLLAGPAAELPDQVRGAVDDLGDRIAALDARLESIELRLNDLDTTMERVVDSVSPPDDGG